MRLENRDLMTRAATAAARTSGCTNVVGPPAAIAISSGWCVTRAIESRASADLVTELVALPIAIASEIGAGCARWSRSMTR
jgi:hypothetical protein